MTRQKRIAISAINIRVHTKHEPQEYVALWREIYRQQLVITRGAYGLMLGEVQWLNKEPKLGLLFGYLYSFVQIDPNDPWFNINSKRPAEDEEVEQVSIPEGLKPNLKMVPYLFDVKKHQLFFLVEGGDGGVSATLVHRFLKHVTSTPILLKRFGRVDLTVMTDQGEVDAMLRWPVIRRLDIVLERVNASEYEDEQEVMARFQAMNLAREERSYVKAEGASTIEPDEDLRKIAAIAANNGVVSVKGVNPRGQSDKAKSTSFPMLIRSLYDSKIQTAVAAFVDKVRDEISKL
jgi:hypothetical protein